MKYSGNFMEYLLDFRNIEIYKSKVPEKMFEDNHVFDIVFSLSSAVVHILISIV